MLVIGMIDADETCARSICREQGKGTLRSAHSGTKDHCILVEEAAGDSE